MHDGKTLPVTRLTLMNYQLSAAKGATSSKGAISVKCTFRTDLQGR